MLNSSSSQASLVLPSGPSLHHILPAKCFKKTTNLRAHHQTLQIWCSPTGSRESQEEVSNAMRGRRPHQSVHSSGGHYNNMTTSNNRLYSSRLLRCNLTLILVLKMFLQRKSLIYNKTSKNWSGSSIIKNEGSSKTTLISIVTQSNFLQCTSSERDGRQSWSAAVSPGQFEHRSSSSVTHNRNIKLGSKATMRTKIHGATCVYRAYHYRWSHTICSKNVPPSDTTSESVACPWTRQRQYTVLIWHCSVVSILGVILHLS